MNTQPTQQRRALRRTISLNPETAAAVAEMEWTLHVRSGGLEEWQSGGEFGNLQSRSRKLNNLLQAMCEAVINCTLPDLGDEMSNQIAWKSPLAFDARRETREERELRVMLASVGEEIQPEAAV